jgi:molybdate transport system substrate-binding protein
MRERTSRTAAVSVVRLTLLAIAVVTAIGVGVGGAQAAEITLLASNAVKEPLQELMPAFAQATGHTVHLRWGGTEAIAKRISDGEAVDAVLIAAPNIDRLIHQGTLAPGSRADVAKSLVGIAIRAGLPKPEVASAEGVKQAVAYSSGPSGFHLQKVFEQMGIAEQIKSKTKQPPSGVQIADLLAHGDADLGFQQVRELSHAPGIEYLGPLPPEIQQVTIWSVGLPPATPAPDAVKALVQFLTSARAVALFQRAGIEPAS